MLSLSHQDQYYQVFLTQGLLGGTACGIMYIPFLHPIMLNRLFNGSVGFHNGVRASAGMNLGLLFFANLLMKPRLPPKKGGMSFPVKDFLRDPPYVFAMISGAMCMMAIFFPIFFLQLFVIKHDMDREFAFYSISILNAASVCGRIIPGFFVPYTGVFNQMIVNTVGIIVVMFCLLAVNNVAGVICFAIFFGFFSGAAVTLMPPLLSTLARDFSEIGARMGICFTVMGFAGLIGAPVAGALLTSEYIWWRAILFAGLLVTLAEVMMIAARFFVVRHLPGGVANHYLYTYIKDTVLRATRFHGRTTHLEQLHFRFNSHSNILAEELQELYGALSLSQPRHFLWTGPDPPHHFSIAIVPRVTVLLLQAVSTWKDLRHLHLTNIAFPTPEQLHPWFQSSSNDILPVMPNIQTVYIGQTTFLSPLAVARFCLKTQQTLVYIRLVDAYKSSIWGQRLRRTDVEMAMSTLILDSPMMGIAPVQQSASELTRRLVICEARTERAMGGDRAENGVTILD
ncbi:hypothetical protein ONZ45_g5629 [Pleurotus djamor]|nr:hypothetical protein ONZ45_g5629 [Pleurotus djamor]